ncbi:hypothetical protein LCGC14_2612130 [marine sediment metagenome]|uniref:HNH nuclease domain-containing protein n=1 Tax=marine sediment metagenome TaxID=412755 RepID=A0A0F9AT85_9ZZZZ
MVSRIGQRRPNGQVAYVGKRAVSCPTCGVSHQRYPSDLRRGRRFCSLACANAAHLPHPSMRTAITLACGVCEAAFQVQPSRLRRGQAQFCSKRCYGISKLSPFRELVQQFYSSQAWLKTRRVVYGRDGYTCADCGNGREAGRRVAHHLIPLSEGGASLDLTNLITLCVHCHNVRHGKFVISNPRRASHALRAI